MCIAVGLLCARALGRLWAKESVMKSQHSGLKSEKYVVRLKCWFPTADITNYHKLPGLKQHGIILTVLEVRSLTWVSLG